MSNPDPSKIIFSTRYKYFLNSGTITQALNMPATSIGAGQSATFTMTIPINNAENYSQIKINFAHDANDWYIFPFIDVPLAANSNIACTGSYSALSLVLKFFVVNLTGGSITSTATVATARVYLFETPE